MSLEYLTGMLHGKCLRVNLRLGNRAIWTSCEHDLVCFSAQKTPHPVATCECPTENVVECRKCWHKDWPQQFEIHFGLPSQRIKPAIILWGNDSEHVRSHFVTELVRPGYGGGNGLPSQGWGKRLTSQSWGESLLSHYSVYGRWDGSFCRWLW